MEATVIIGTKEVERFRQINARLKAIEANLKLNGYRVIRGIEELIVTPTKGYLLPKKQKDFLAKLAASYSLIGQEASEPDRAGMLNYRIG